MKLNFKMKKGQRSRRMVKLAQNVRGAIEKGAKQRAS